MVFPSCATLRIQKKLALYSTKTLLEWVTCLQRVMKVLKEPAASHAADSEQPCAVKKKRIAQKKGTYINAIYEYIDYE
jgi:hypothetical protein